MKTVSNFDELLALLAARGDKRLVAVVCPNDEGTQGAVCRALDLGLIDAILVGATDEARRVFDRYGDRVDSISAADVDDAARKAVALVREGRADVLQKGLLNTDNLLRAVLDKETGILPKGQVLTHMTCASLPRYDKLLFFTDVAVIPYPTKEQREAQLRYLLALCRRMGIEVPRVALINCSEKVNAKHFPCTVEYRELVERAQAGDFGPCIVDGPLDLKTSVSAEALHKKGIDSPVEGHADGLIFPDIQAGNVFYKSVTWLGDARTAAILQGPQVPVVLTSRADSRDTKFFSLVLACI